MIQIVIVTVFNKFLCWHIGSMSQVTIDDFKIVVIFNACMFKLKLLICELHIYYI